MKKINLACISLFISTPLFSSTLSQDFQSFENGRSWYVSDFGVQDIEKNESTVEAGQIKFKVKWTKRSRNHLADKLNIPREEMSVEAAAEICAPVLEFGRANVYAVGSNDNMIAELDSDLSQCGIGGSEPANVAIKAKIPTIPGHYYKVKFKYVMRNYGRITPKSYKNLVVRFGPELEKFDPVFGVFQEKELSMLSRKKLSRLVFRDNGLPDSYGILLDDIEVLDMGEHPNNEECSKRYKPGSKTFNSCIDGEIDLDETCDSFNTVTHKKQGLGVVESRADVSNAFNMEGEIRGRVNFLSLGLGGKAVFSCKYEQSNKNALIDIYGKTLKIKEITWGNETIETYPESAIVRAKLENCAEESLNGVVDLATLTTKQELSYSFEKSENGLSYEGCQLRKLVLKDTTPSGPSTDGIDINSIIITD